MPFDPDDLNKNIGNGQNKSGNDNDDFVGSSFAVQFKPGDTANSVSDKLKESQNDNMDDFDSFKDEFDDFVLDDTISAFKPLSDSEPAKPAFAPGNDGAKDQNKEADIPAFPKDGGTFDRKPSDDVSKGPDKTNTPVFGNTDKAQDKTSASDKKKDEKL